MSKRFGQGNDVDRDRPHFFHRDYWTLRILREELLTFLASHGASLRGGRAVDLGSGEAPYRKHFEEAGIELLCADIEPADPSVLPIDVTGRTPLPDASVAAVISTQVLEHVPDVQRYLGEARRLLRPGGKLYLSTHGAFVLHRHPTDLRRWTVDGLRFELEQAGFIVENIKPRLGIVASSTHLRSIAIGGLLRRSAATRWLRPLVYALFNLRMAVEDYLTPASVMEAHPELLIAVATAP